MAYYSIYCDSSYSIDDELIEAKNSRDALQKYLDSSGQSLTFERSAKNEKYDYTVTPMATGHNDNTNWKIGDNVRYKITGGSDYKPPLTYGQRLLNKMKKEREKNLNT